MLRNRPYRWITSTYALVAALLFSACGPAYQPKILMQPGQSEAEVQAAVDACRMQARAAVRANSKEPSAGETLVAVGALALVVAAPIAAPLSATAGAALPVSTSLGAATLAAGPTVATTGAVDTSQPEATARARQKLDTLEAITVLHRAAMDACLQERGVQLVGGPQPQVAQ